MTVWRKCADELLSAHAVARDPEELKLIAGQQNPPPNLAQRSRRRERLCETALRKRKRSCELGRGGSAVALSELQENRAGRALRFLNDSIGNRSPSRSAGACVRKRVKTQSPVQVDWEGKH